MKYSTTLGVAACFLFAAAFGFITAPAFSAIMPALTVTRQITTQPAKACYTEREILKLTNTATELGATRDILANLIQAKEGDVEKLTQLKEKVETESRKIAKLTSTSTLEKAQSKAAALRTEKQQLEAKQTKTTSDVRRLKNLVAEIAAADKAVKDLVSKSTTATSTLGYTVSGVTKSLAEVKRELADAREEQRVLASKYASAMTTLRTAKGKACGTAASKTQARTASTQACYDEKKMSALKDDVASLEKIIADHPAIITALKESRTTKEAEIKTYATTLATLKRNNPTDAALAAAEKAFNTASAKLKAALEAPVGSALYATRSTLGQKEADASAKLATLKTARNAYNRGLEWDARLRTELSEIVTKINNSIAELDDAQRDIDIARKDLSSAKLCEKPTTTSSSNTVSRGNTYALTCYDDQGQETPASHQCPDGSMACDGLTCPYVTDTSDYVPICEEGGTESEESDDTDVMGSGWRWNGFGVFGNQVCGATSGSCRKGYEWDPNGARPVQIDGQWNDRWTCVLRQKNALGAGKCEQIGLDPEKIINTKTCPGS